jgi:hypothetical protein
MAESCLPNRARSRYRYRALIMAGEKRQKTSTRTIRKRVQTRLTPGSARFPRPGTCSWSVLPDPSDRGRAADLC